MKYHVPVFNYILFRFWNEMRAWLYAGYLLGCLFKRLTFPVIFLDIEVVLLHFFTCKAMDLTMVLSGWSVASFNDSRIRRTCRGLLLAWNVRFIIFKTVRKVSMWRVGIYYFELIAIINRLFQYAAVTSSRGTVSSGLAQSIIITFLIWFKRRSWFATQV